MEDKTSIFAMRVGVLLVAGFLVACLKSCEEINFRTRGKTAATQIKDIREDRGKFGNLIGYLVSYDFLEASSGRVVTASSQISTTERDKYRVGDPLEIEYYGHDVMTTTRIKGTSNYFWPAFLVLSIIAMAVVIGVMSASAERKRNGPKKPKKLPLDRGRRSFGH